MALPLRYYLGGGGADERFAWRMFSSQRLAECDYAISADGRSLDPRDVLGVSAFTVDAIPRGDPDVVAGFMRWWCAHRGASQIHYQNRCTLPGGAEAPARGLWLDCASAELRREGPW